VAGAGDDDQPASGPRSLQLPSRKQWSADVELPMNEHAGYVGQPVRLIEQLILFPPCSVREVVGDQTGESQRNRGLS
jgi:hypothetical protein